MRHSSTAANPDVRLGKRLAFLAYLICLAVAAEILARILDLAPPYTPQPDTAIHLYHTDPNGLILLRPNAHYYTNGNVPMFINKDGYRDRVYSLNRIPKTCRIAILGDSFTIGDGVRITDSYPEQLETLYADSGESVEVLNFGLSATNTLNQLELMKSKVLDYQPDLIVLGFNLNDYYLRDETSFDRARRLYSVLYRVNSDGTVTIQRPHRTGLDGFKHTIYKRSELWRALYRVGESRGADNRDLSHPVLETLTRFREDKSELGRHQTSRAIAAMGEILRERGIHFLCLIVPAMTVVSRDRVRSFDDYPFRDLHLVLAEFLSRESIEYLELLPFFGDRPLADVLVSRFDPHFNSHGNAIIAAALKETLVCQADASEAGMGSDNYGRVRQMTQSEARN